MATDTVVMFESQFQQELFEDAALRLGISLTDLAKHARHLMLDPVPVRGATITLSTKRSIDDVPLPSANVDLCKAWAHMRVDDCTCECMLENSPSHEDVLRVIRNQLAWMKFLAARLETPEAREVYRTLVAFREATIRALVARFRAKRGGQAMADELEAVLEPMQ